MHSCLARGELPQKVNRGEGSGIGYLEARRIRDLLVQSNPDSRNFFGRLSGIAVSGLFSIPLNHEVKVRQRFFWVKYPWRCNIDLGFFWCSSFMIFLFRICVK
jgi:hypothetical protein